MKNKIFSILISAWLLLLTLAVAWLYKDDSLFSEWSGYQDQAPRSSEIKKILEPLRYNGLYRLLEPQVRIVLNTKELTWTLKNVHRFDEQGNIVLSRERFGVCGDLAAYTYTKIKPLLGKRYDIDFLTTAESSFFKAGNATHIVLRAVEKNPALQNRIFLIDPAFKKYGRPEDVFKNYLPLEVFDLPEFLKKKDPDETFSVDGGPPIFINRNTLFSLFVIGANGKFDEQNYAVALTACERYHYLNEYVYTVMKSEGETQVFDNGEHLGILMPPGKYDQLKKVATDLFDRVSAAGDQASKI